jgi:hypothetical protein
MSKFNQKLLFLASLILIYLPGGDLLLVSPAIFISMLAFVKSIRRIFRQHALIIYLILTLAITAVIPDQSIKEFARLIFVIGSFFVIKYLNILERDIFYSFTAFFIFELAIRVAAGDFSEINLYSIKGSAGLFGDSNFVGLILVYCIAGLIDQESLKTNKLKILILVILLVATFSRTAWIMLAAFVISRKSKVIGVVLVAIAALTPVYFFYMEIDVKDIDGSLSSKIIIFNTFLYTLLNDPTSLLWGLGRTAPGVIAEELSGTTYQGHTLYGQIVQYGIIMNFIFYLVAYKLSKLIVRDSFPLMASALVGAFLGLSPTSYFGIILLVYGIFRRGDNEKHKIESISSGRKSESIVLQGRIHQ